MTIHPLIKSISSAIGYTAVVTILGLVVTEGFEHQEWVMGVIITASLLAITRAMYPLFRREHERHTHH